MSTAIRRDVFQAIADPTRREIISLVSRRSMNLNAIAENFDMSRPAISQHIKILTECGILAITQQGRERYCRARLETLDEVSGWMDECRQFWTTQFKSLEKYLAKAEKTKKIKK